MLRRNIYLDVWKLFYFKSYRYYVFKSFYKGLFGYDFCGGCGSELCEIEGDSFIRFVLIFEFCICKVYVNIDGSKCIFVLRDLSVYVRKLVL